MGVVQGKHGSRYRLCSMHDPDVEWAACRVERDRSWGRGPRRSTWDQSPPKSCYEALQATSGPEYQVWENEGGLYIRLRLGPEHPAHEADCAAGPNRAVSFSTWRLILGFAPDVLPFDAWADAQS